VAGFTTQPPVYTAQLFTVHAANLQPLISQQR